MSHMQKGYAGSWSSSYYNQEKIKLAAEAFRWDEFILVLKNAFVPLNEIQDAQDCLLAFKQGRLPSEEYLTKWGQILVAAQYPRVPDDSTTADYLINLLHKNMRQPIIHAVEEEPGMYTSRSLQMWIECLQKKGQILEYRVGGFNEPSRVHRLAQPTFTRPVAPCPMTQAPTSNMQNPLEQRDTTGVTYRGQGQPMDVDRQ
ncbi:hypothetical protein PAXINDRAFT_15487 [Paxillus involutus ATCC 200175]|uniref:Retrotransposon gag domain-containing protein n=1 Tax=Paxillus involutus ATCC 200175 TaxID=664439 RepID=A0A0C9TM83_PAXIN|nr:hypothetical protein PAXINDRAFT_15487 [Paxillus involutus ATCC 200175]